MLNFMHPLHHKTDREILMTIYNELADIKVALAALSAQAPSTPIDISTLATAAEVAGVSAQVTALDAKVGVEPPPAA